MSKIDGRPCLALAPASDMTVFGTGCSGGSEESSLLNILIMCRALLGAPSEYCL